MEHRINPTLLRGRVRVHLVGVGGNGAQMAHCLARLDLALRALGHPAGLHLTAYDADRVSEANVGRQVYSPSDIGQHKAVLTIHRLNQFYGLDWEALPTRYAVPRAGHPAPDIVVSCVDSARSRRDVHQGLFGHWTGTRYWLDLGNTEATGQIVLGEPRCRAAKDEWARLPCVTELFPQLLDEGIKEDATPSCSVRMSLASQGLFVNDIVVRWAGQFLYELFSTGLLRQHGVVVNLDAKRCGPIDVDPAVWKRFGVQRRRPRGLAAN